MANSKMAAALMAAQKVCTQMLNETFVVEI